MRALASVFFSLVIAAGLLVAVLALWSGVEDVQRRHHGPLPDVAPPATRPVSPAALPPVRFQVPADAGGVRAGKGLAAALFDRDLGQKARQIRGRADPAPGAEKPVWVAVFGPTLLAGPVQAAADGSFVLESVPDAPATLVLGDEPLALRTGYRKRVRLEQRGDVDLGTVAAPTHPLDVLVVDTGGVPVRGAVAWLTSREDPEWRPVSSITAPPTASRERGHAGSDSSGTLRMEGLPGGRFDLHVLVPARKEPLSQEVSLPAAGTVTVTVATR